MKTKRNVTSVVMTFVLLFSVTVLAQSKEKTVQVGGAPMYPSKNIVENAVNSKDHTTLVAAVKAAGLVVKDLLPFLPQPMQHLINCQKEQLKPY